VVALKELVLDYNPSTNLLRRIIEHEAFAPAELSGPSHH